MTPTSLSTLLKGQSEKEEQGINYNGNYLFMGNWTLSHSLYLKNLVLIK